MTLRWGIIGVGDIAKKRVAAAIVQDANSHLVAVCRRNEAELAQFAEQYNVPERYSNAEDLIASDQIDAVYVATPVDCHCPQTIAAAQSGKHVLVEKPMALDTQECSQMVEACRAAKVTLGVAYYRRFYPVAHRIRELIDSGQLGRVLSVGCVTGNPLEFAKDDWRVCRQRGGGGPLMDIGSHRIDLMHELLGEIDQVKAMTLASPNYEAEQVASLLMHFSSGAQGILQSYFGTVYTPDRLEVVGTSGHVLVEDLNAGSLQLTTRDGKTVESHPPAENFHAPLVEDFSLAVLEKRPPKVDGEVGLLTSQAIELAYADANR